MNWLKLMLYNELIIISDKSPKEAINLLEKHVDGKSSFFTGSVYNYSFDIRRRFDRFERNSFVPVIKGTIREHNSGSQIKITMRLHLLVIAFMVTWTFGLLDTVFRGVIIYHNFILVIFLGVFCMAWLIAWQVYDGEVTAATNFLKRLFS